MYILLFYFIFEYYINLQLLKYVIGDDSIIFIFEWIILNINPFISLKVQLSNSIVYSILSNGILKKSKCDTLSFKLLRKL